MHLESAELASLRRGMQHFRAGEYFAAHDDWEEVWQGLRGRQRTFWQAMIQLVVGAYHLRNGNRKGCESLSFDRGSEFQSTQGRLDEHLTQPIPKTCPPLHENARDQEILTVETDHDAGPA